MSEKITRTYADLIRALLDKLEKTQSENIGLACSAAADALQNGGMIYAFGTGHSHMLAEELFYRAGGLVRVVPVFDDPLMLHVGASRSSEIERLPGYAATLFGQWRDPKKNDVFFIFSNSGRNAVPVEAALEMKARGVKTVAVTNLAHSRASASRHDSGKRLFEICDIVIDNGGCVGDAALDIGGSVCGATSTVIGAAIVQMIACGTVDELIQRGVEPEVFKSSNVDGGDEINHEYIKKYQKEIPIL
ncbi:MAG: SIS domain-containing protein [Clostridia bacterium]|nr:SIS domain-containing protein [Clostridia bacterium]